MPKLTRRKLIRQASIGAGAIGMLAATASTTTQHTSKASAHTSGLAAGEALVVYVTNAEAGTLTVLHGERETTINNVALVQHLLSL